MKIKMQNPLYDEIFRIDFSIYKNSYIFYLTDETIEALMGELKIDLETLKIWNEKASLATNLVASKNSVRNRQVRTIGGDVFPFDVRKLAIDPDQIDTVNIEERGSNTIITIVGFPLSDKQYDILDGIKSGTKITKSIIYVEGPIALDEISVQVKDSSGKTVTKQFYLFSDLHVHLNMCPQESIPFPKINIVQFLRQIMEKDPKFVDKRVKYEPIDFFLEVSHPGDLERDESQFGFDVRGKEIAKSTSYLTDIRKDLYDCFQKSKVKCRDRQNRYHWSDSRYRGIFLDWLNFFSNYQSLLSFVGMVTGPLKTDASRKLFPIMLKEAEFLMKQTPTDIDEFFRIAKVSKQIANIYDTEIAKKIHSYYFRLVQGKWIDVKKRLRNVAEDFNKGKDVVIQGIDTLMEILFALSLLMDAYTIARSFREFRVPGKEGPALNNIIIYAGQKHIESMYILLSDLGEVGQRSQSSDMQTGTDFQCLKVEVPLFSI